MENTLQITSSRFPLGEISVSRSAATRITTQDAEAGLCRHAQGDWGSVPAEKRLRNEDALREGHAVLSRFRAASGYSFWIITDYDRGSTIVF